jgi:hypothetical protein
VTSCQTVSSSLWTDAAVFFTALGALVFVVSYAWTTRGAWRDSIMGKHVMSFMAAILAVCLLAVIGIIWGTDWPYRNAIRSAAWATIGACIWWRVWLLIRVQHRDSGQVDGRGR